MASAVATHVAVAAAVVVPVISATAAAVAAYSWTAVVGGAHAKLITASVP